MIAERLGLIRETADTLITKGIAYGGVGRTREGIGLLEAGLGLATSAGLTATVLRAQINLTGQLPIIDSAAAVKVAQEGAETARRYGFRHGFAILVGNGAEASLPTGDWAWASRAVEEVLALDIDDTDRAALGGIAIGLRATRGQPYEHELAELEEMAGRRAAHRVTLGLARIWIATANGQAEMAAEEALHVAEQSSSNASQALSMSARAAILGRDRALAQKLLDRLTETRQRGPTLDAQRVMIEAGLRALDGDWQSAVSLFGESQRRTTDMGLTFDLGLVWLAVVATAPAGDPLAATAEREARAIFERVGAPPYLAQLDRLTGRGEVAGPATTESATVRVR